MAPTLKQAVVDGSTDHEFALVSRALARIAEGALDAGSVAHLAQSLAVSDRHLTRLFRHRLGASPTDFAKARRLHLAKRLLDDSTMSLARIAGLAGFGSVRQFNAVVRATYGCSPRELRRQPPDAGSPIERPRQGTDGSIALRLPVREPFNRRWLLEYFATRAVPGLEEVSGQKILRVHHDGGICIDLSVDDARTSGGTPGSVKVSWWGDRANGDSFARDIVAVERLLDLGADPHAYQPVLALDPLLRGVVGQFPGLRVPGAWDGFEVAVRAVIGQQVSVAGATTLAKRLLERYGETPAVPASTAIAAGLLASPRLFPTPDALRRENPAGIGMPGKRGAAIQALAQRVAAGDLHFDRDQRADQLAKRLQAVPGIGPWTAQYVAMRALGDPDAFPAEDIVLRKVAGAGAAMPTRQLSEYADKFRPWRAYAVMYLWKRAMLERADELKPGAPS